MAPTAMHFATEAGIEPRTIARGLRRRDPDLLDALIDRYQFRLFRYLLSLTRNREIADDLFQETWVRVLDRGHQYDGRCRFEAWLFTVARRLVLDLHRKRTPGRLDDLGTDDGAPFEPASPGPGIDEVLAAAQQGMAVRGAVDALPAIHREVLLLRFQEDLSLEEIAGVVHIPLATVKSRLYRGLEGLRVQLGGRNV